MSRLVVDSSVCLAWCFDDETTAYADAIHEHILEHGAMVPSLWPYEVANGLLVSERRERLTPTESAEFLEMLGSLDLEIESRDMTLAFGITMELARQQSLTVYDAAYLELAIRRRAPLATLDDALRRAAKSIGAELK